MPIQEVHLRGQTHVVTFTSHDLQFSASLVEEKNLDVYHYVRLGVDEELYRLYIGFAKKSAPGLAKFYSQSGRSSRMMIAVGKLYSQFKWIGHLKTEKDKTKRQFELEDVDPKQKDIYEKYQFYISLKPEKK